MNVHFGNSRKAVGLWLLAVAAIIMAMVTIGGLTRLTGSGLSIMEWDPIMGAIPPLTADAWQDVFHKYQQIQQYKVEHQGMSLEAFQGIFWWEWTHRFLGRLLGAVFLLPFLWFAAIGAIRKVDWPRFVVLFLLGGLQGFIGWWMVSSGFEDRTSVSQYRLAIHLGAAILLLGAILWTALEYLHSGAEPGKVETGFPSGSATKNKRGFVLVALIYCQMLLGALVAGLHAGLIYNTWPDMNGGVFPEDAFFSSPWWINFFENPGLAQFDHRIGAYVVAGVAAFIFARGVRLTGWAKKSAKAVAIITAIQIFLGIVTLIMLDPEVLAALHQVTAATLFCAAVWHTYELRRA